MKERMKRLASTVLMLCVLLALLTCGAAAAEITDSGTCGDNLTWTLDAEGTLTIRGAGAMKDYDWYDNRSPWYDNEAIHAIVVNPGVTRIGCTAFSGCGGLTSVTIPDSVTSIGDYAFCDCSGLTSVTIPDSVTSIGDYAFCDCSGLTSVTIPDSVTSIGDYAFCDCSGLTSVVIPDSVTSIGSVAFSGCDKLTDVFYGGTYEDWKKLNIRDWELPCTTRHYSPDWTALSWKEDGEHITITDCDTKAGGNLEVPEEIAGKPVTGIETKAFQECSGLTSVMIPDSVTSIGDYAFCDCSGLTSVTIPDSVTSISWNAFSGCSGLTSMTIPDSVTSIGGHAFSGCSGLTSVTIPDSVTSISWGTFSGCSGLKSVTIPDSVTSIGGYAFSGCSGLKSVTIPKSVTSIEQSTFQDCTSLESVRFEHGNGQYWYWSIGSNAFAGCTALKNIQFDDMGAGSSSVYIYNYAFDGCVELRELVLPGVETIGEHAFQNCTGLESLTIQGQSSFSIGNYAFLGCTSLKNVHLTDHLSVINTGAFRNCESMTDVYYCGSEEEWAGLSVKGYNDPLTNAKIHYNSHDWSAWTATQTATPIGVRHVESRTCSVCGETETRIVIVEVSSIEIDKQNVEILSGRTETLKATVKPNDATDQSVIWSSSNNDVATVRNGVVTGIKAGTAVITAKAGEKTATCSVTVTDPVNFTDVNETDFFYHAVEWALERQITRGTSDTTFSPFSPCTRGQAVTFLWRANGSVKVTDIGNPFTDIAEDDYYYDAVLWAYSQHITTGFSEHIFGPEETCTRGQIVTFLWRTRGTPNANARVSFSDVPEDAYYFNAVKWAVAVGVTNGTSDTTFSPDSPCTRGQIVTFLWRDPTPPWEPATPEPEPPAELPEGVNSIAATGQAALLALIAGGSDILVATDDTTKANAAASGAFGGLANTAPLWRNTGSGGITDADFQTLLQMKPDAVLEISGDAAISGSQAAQLEAAGISYVPLPQMTSVENIKQAAGTLGEMIADRSSVGGKNGKQQAKNYANWVDSIYDKVEKSTKDYKTKVDAETGTSYGTYYTLYINGWDPAAVWSVTNTPLSGNGAAYVFNAATTSTAGITTFLGYANIINTSSKYGIQPQSKYLTPLYLGKSAQQSWNINGVSGSGYYQGQEKLLEQDAASLGTGNFKTILVPDASVKQAIESDRDSGNGLWSVYGRINTGDGGFYADGFRDQNGGIVRTQIADYYNVVVNPKGLMSDWVSGGPEGIFESLWAAHQYFVAVTEDELRQEMKDFYNTYYEMTVTDAQIDALLAGY